MKTKTFIIKVLKLIAIILLLSVNGKIKCRKSVKLNVGFPTFFINDTITIEVIVKMNENNEIELRNKQIK